MTRNKKNDDMRAAIVCEHIAGEGRPIKSAFKMKPVEAEDSGWQFFCGDQSFENSVNAKIWLAHEVLEYEPSLARFMEMPVGTRLWRTNTDSEWQSQSFPEGTGTG